VVQQRPAVDRLGELVPPEARGPATGEHDRADGRAACGAAVVPARIPRQDIVPAGRGARGPGTCPSAVRRRIARRSRSSRMAITYLRLVPVASR